jgi:hypothetical protein
VNRKRGNPNWGKPEGAVVANPAPTSFEEIVKKLRLRRVDYLCSQQLKDWVRKNKDRKYVPLDLLEAWNFEAEGE